MKGKNLTGPGKRLLQYCAALLAVTVSALLCVLPAQGFETRHILVLHSYHSGMSWVDDLEKGIRDNLLQPPYEDAIVHTEYMDTKRNQSAEYYDRLIRIYREIPQRQP